MSYDTYEEFYDQMTDILSSGCGFDFRPWHKEQIEELVSGMDSDRVIEDLNIYYGDQEPSNLLEGELETISDMVESEVSVKITFTKKS